MGSRASAVFTLAVTVLSSVYWPTDSRPLVTAQPVIMLSGTAESAAINNKPPSFNFIIYILFRSWHATVQRRRALMGFYPLFPSSQPTDLRLRAFLVSFFRYFFCFAQWTTR